MINPYCPHLIIPRGVSETAESVLTVFTTAEPTCHSNSQVKMLPRAQWQEFKFLNRPNTLIHLIACMYESELNVEKNEN